MKTLETIGMYPVFSRSGKETCATHYCAGCGHGIIHKLLTEALVELGLQDRAVIVNPIGCGVFGYYYWDVGNISSAHGRAPAVATGVVRSKPDAVTIAYQGDGDLAAIGFNQTFQAASRGEQIAVIFVNNSLYGMTGGQMAPTTLLGQKTTTSPFGRNALNDGYPMHVSEVLNQLAAPVYIERVSVADTARIMKAKAAIRKALAIQRDRKGYAFVEILAPCPTNLGMDSLKSARFTIDQMEKEYPLGCLRDRTAEAQTRPAPPARTSLNEFFADAGASDVVPQNDPSFKEMRMKFTGFGGQGILSLGLVIAEAARSAGRHTSWFPSYGPEQRGGAASCSVTVSGKRIGAPAVDHPDLLIAMNQPAYERFISTVRPGGIALVDETVKLTQPAPQGVKVVHFPAISLSNELGMPKAANTAMLGALIALNATGLSKDQLLNALDASFAKKPALIPRNRAIAEAAAAWFAK